MAIVLKNEDGDIKVVQQGESCNLVGTFDFGSAIEKAALATLTITLFNKPTDGDPTPSVINSRNAQSVLDANGGTVTAAGVLTMKLDASDNTIIDTTNIAVGEHETHVARLTWTWTDDDGDTRTGIEELEFDVQRVASPS